MPIITRADISGDLCVGDGPDLSEERVEVFVREGLGQIIHDQVGPGIIQTDGAIQRGPGQIIAARSH